VSRQLQRWSDEDHRELFGLKFHGEWYIIAQLKLRSTSPGYTCCDDIGTVTRSTVPYSAQIDSGSERGTRWYMWYSSVIRQFPKHVRDIRVFISMQNSTLYDGIKGVLNGV
jgi:hypothetical protein